MALRTSVVACAFSLLALAIPLSSHHSSAGSFDVNTTVTIEGVITKVMLANPHSAMYLDVKTSNGRPETWILYGNPPNALTRLGYSNSTFKEGIHVTAVGNPARDSSSLTIAGHILDSHGKGKTVHVIEVGEIRFADGQVVSFGRGPAFNSGIAGQRGK
jgi:hypothetical protein